MLFCDQNSDRALKLWSQKTERISSSLLEVECLNVINRYALRLPSKVSLEWRAQSQRWLDRTLGNLTLISINSLIRDKIRSELNLGALRTLDAIHVATALLFRQVELGVEIATFDTKMIASLEKYELQLAE